MDYAILINWTSPFPILGVSGVIFHFYFIFDRNFCMQKIADPNPMPRSVAFDLVLHCLPMSQKMGRYAYMG